MCIRDSIYTLQNHQLNGIHHLAAVGFFATGLAVRAYAVAPAQGVAQVAEGGELQILRKAVVGEVVLHGAGGLECLVEGIFNDLVAVAGAEGGEQAECLVAYTEVLAEAEVPAQFAL